MNHINLDCTVRVVSLTEYAPKNLKAKKEFKHDKVKTETIIPLKKQFRKPKKIPVLQKDPEKAKKVFSFIRTFLIFRNKRNWLCFLN